MNGCQLIITLLGLISLAVSFWAILCVARSRIRYKAAWIIGSLFGFAGLGIVWTKPDDLILLIGVQIPPVTIFKVLGTQFVIVKVQFPVVALLALGKSELGEAGHESHS